MSNHEQSNQSLHVPSTHTGRIRSHSLKPQHSRLDYARRKSAADISSAMISCLEATNDIDDIEKRSLKSISPSWLKRRFTLFSLEKTIHEKRRMTSADCLYNCNDRASSILLKQKRPSVISQMLESFVRRLSSRKKKHHEHEEDETIIDPVYETLKIAAETRKKTIATYLQQRQQSLNQQTSLNSQGSLELDTQQASPRVTRQSDINSSARSKPPPSSSSSSGR